MRGKTSVTKKFIFCYEVSRSGDIKRFTLRERYSALNEMKERNNKISVPVLKLNVIVIRYPLFKQNN